MWAPVIPRALPVPSLCPVSSPMREARRLRGKQNKATHPRARGVGDAPVTRWALLALGRSVAKGRLPTPPKPPAGLEASRRQWKQPEALRGGGTGTWHDICVLHVGRHQQDKRSFCSVVGFMPVANAPLPPQPQLGPNPCFSHRQGWAQTLEGATGQQDGDGDVVSRRQSEQRNWSAEASRAHRGHAETVAFSRSVTVLVTK